MRGQLDLTFPEDTHLVALSGGADSSAMALALAEREPRDYTYICTPTGDELPEMVAHMERLERLLGKPILRIINGTLDGWIEEFAAVPNWRMRWCTRLLKIQPFMAWIRQQPGRVVTYVGLRADEPLREGLLVQDDKDGTGPTILQRYPLRRWGWNRKGVSGFLKCHGVEIPRRTDCARCYGQQLGEWHNLWEQHPDIYEGAAAQERAYGHTFRSAQRDTWPAGLDELAAEFMRGRKIRQQNREFDGCRVCRL